MSARDLARFGQLYLREGRWNGRQVLSAQWISESTRAHVTTDFLGSGSSYGCLWWIRDDGSGFFASGNGGQYLFVAPKRNIVVVHLTDTDTKPPSVSRQDAFRILRMLGAAAAGRVPEP
jgi:CubicO group peptidase (beta-lactamase class C family)